MRYVVLLLIILPTIAWAQIEAQTIDGKQLQVPGENKASLLVFWASWCSSCAHEAPMLVKLHGELNGRIRIIGVNVDRKAEKALPFIEKHGITYPTINDADLKISKQFKINSTPQLILLDAQGKEVHRATKIDKALVSQIRQQLKAMKPKVEVVKKARPRTQVISRSPDKVHEQHSAIMGTDIHILIHTDDKKRADLAIAAAFQEFKRIDDAMTDWRPVGQVWQLNKQAGQGPIKVSSELFSLLETAKEISKTTGGLFDISYKGVGNLWNFYQEPQQIPSPDQIAAGLQLVDYEAIILDKQALTVALSKKGMQIGLGGIAKGYAVDQAVAIISTFGFKDFVVNAGGDLYVKASNEDALWRVGVRNPRNADAIIAEIPAKNYAIVTSGDYERFFIKDGKRYCHIINPKTGWPADECQSVTVLAKTSMRADALATGVFLMGAKKGIAMVETLDQVEALLVDAQGNVHMSSGFKQ